MQYYKMPNASVKWYGDELEAGLKRVAYNNMVLIGELLKDQIKKNISSSKASGHSSPGDYPGLDTGKLRDSIYYHVDSKNLTLTVGTDLAYGIFLEYGTSGGKTIVAPPGKVFSWIDPQTGQRHFATKVTLGPIKQRSFLRRTLYEQFSAIKNIFELDIKEGELRLPG